ncbi:MAG TPA: TetR/AcrR family transcriptional regulator [Pseudonocardia sp.]|jgi:AcrR family transcriptional regulator|uniref:TetR/AcrR family transcriptional regulator n=1 Tax=Pseudonocardia sp. TaxID=60912 RepID=UPI002BCA5176|nr:TetR/AcrR family transcriptional regulator [Pseudonocardia sp.]HTF49006.1 TetR/AcrR family transcriptional regulator [Pseudonocardia sp.]
MSSTTEPTPTVWGDAEGRRRDILASAERALEESGYAGLTMRAIAAGAGVSPGTVYQYFDGKEDVFVALMSRRLDELRATLDGMDRDIGIAELLRRILPQLTELWRRFGRSTPQWEAKVLAGGRRSKGVVTTATVYLRTVAALAAALRDTAAARGQTLWDDPAVPHWVWDSLIGVADDLLHTGAKQNRVTPDQLVRFATEAIERGILAS